MLRRIRHTHHAVSKGLGLRSVVGNEQHGYALLLQGAQQFMDAHLGLRIQTGGRLIHNEHIRIAGNNASNGRKTLLST